MSHPNRSKTKTANSNPLPSEVVALRHSQGLTQSQAAELWLTTLSTVQRWEAPLGQANNRRVHPLMWWAMQKMCKFP